MVDAQNRLLRLGDKTIATSLLYMSEWERDRVIALLGREKGTRVRDEVRRQERSRVAYDYYETAVRSMITALEGGTTGPPRTYYRPTRSRTR